MQPDLIITPFGENATPGTIEAIPEALAPGDPVQRASWSAGFPQATMTPLAAGGVPPRGQDFNGVLNAITQHSVFQGGGGQYKWSAEFVAASGGYSIGAVVQSNDGRVSYVSLVNSNTIDFNTSPESIGVQWAFYSGEVASQPEAEAGTNNAKSMTPLRAFQAIRSAAANATELLRGVLRVGTQSEVTAGVRDDVAVTPKKLRMGFAISLGLNGYVAFPSWLGGLIVQWGGVTASTAGVFSAFPLAFPNEFLKVVIGINNGSSYNFTSSAGVPSGLTGFTAYANGSAACSYVAIGF